MIEVLLAAPAQSIEAELVATAPASGVHIVRRCIDAVDVLAAFASHPDAMPIISASLPRLVAATVERLGPRTVGLADDDEDVGRLLALGVDRIVLSSEQPLWEALVSGDVRVDGPLVTLASAVEIEQVSPQDMNPRSAGSVGVIAVWGPPGAPGRTTVAIGLADALARAGHRVCLVDADTYAPSIACALGTGVGAISVACARVESGRESDVASLCTLLSSRLSVLSGLGPTHSWRELRPSSLTTLWGRLRHEFDGVVVDIGSCVEDDDAGSPWASRRNAAAVTALQSADRVVAVADTSPVGAARLALEWPRLADSMVGGRTIVVQNRAHRRSGDWRRAMAALGIDAPMVSIPEDSRCVTSCWSHAATLSEHAPRSRVTRAMRTLAAAVVRD